MKLIPTEKPTDKNHITRDYNAPSKPLNGSRGSASRGGFALVLSLSLMAFILLLVLSLSTFLSVESSSSRNQKQLLKARQSALLGLQVALGQLQYYAGADQRTTGSAELIEDAGLLRGGLKNPYWTGVWRNAGTRSTEPGMTENQPQLLNWLISGNEGIGLPAPADPNASPTFAPDADLNRNLKQLSPTAGDQRVTLVGDGSATLSTADLDGDGIEDGGGIVAPLIEVIGPAANVSTRFAYWVADEGTKARVNLTDPLENASPDSDEGRARLSAPPRSGAELYARDASTSGDLWGSDFEGNSPSNKHAYTISDLAHALDTDSNTASQLLQQRFHDLTLWSKSLLTDVKNGGRRHDLTTATRLPSALWTTFKQSVSTGAEEHIFPPRSGTASGNDPGGPYWDLLRSFVQDGADSGGLEPRTQTLGQHGFAPILQEFKMFVAPSLTGSATNRGARLHYMPVLTLWNPYDRPLKAQDYYITFGPLYPLLRVHLGLSTTHWAAPGGSGAPDRTARMDYNLGNGHRSDPPEITPDRAYRFRIECPEIPPGRAIVFSPPDGGRAMALSSQLPSNANPFNLLEPGFRPGSNYYIDCAPFEEGALLATDEVYHLSISGTDGAYTDLRVGLSPTAVADDPLLVVHNLLMWYLHDWSSAGGFQHMTTNFYPRVTQSSSTSPILSNTFTDANNTYLETPVFGYWMQLRMSEKILGGSEQLPHPWLRTYNPRGPFYGESMIEARNNGIAPRGFGYIPTYYKTLALENLSDLTNINISSGSYTYPGYSVSSPIGEQAIAFRAFEDDNALFSIGDLMHANLVPGLSDPAQMLHEMQYASNYPSYAVGSSAQSPYIPLNSTEPFRNTWPSGTKNLFKGGEDGVFYDLPYLLNDALWDRFYFSAVDPSTQESRNPRLVPLGSKSALPYNASDTLSFASGHGLLGGFNINSTSVDAWAAVLGAYLGIQSNLNNSIGPDESLLDRVAFPQIGSARAGDSADEDNAWGGSRVLRADEIRALAEAIVGEIKSRGPFLSLSHFINRDLKDSNAGEARKRGALDAAIKASGINDGLYLPVGSNELQFDESDFPSGGDYYSFDNYNLSALTEPVTDQIPGAVTQPDLLAKFGSILSARSDTFTIRFYGDSIERVNGEPVRIWGEAVVQRSLEPVTPSASDASEPSDDTRQTWGRRFHIIAFRWLQPDEV